MVEIEIGVMVKQCLDRRLADNATLISEIAAWERRRNATKLASTGCLPSTALGRRWGRVYPQPTGRSSKAAA
jgi:hypothetical protein